MMHVDHAMQVADEASMRAVPAGDVADHGVNEFRGTL
jgi:hypothetical protein